MDVFLTIVSILVLLLVSAFLSGSETALTAARRSRIHQLEVAGDKRANLAARLISRRERLIGAILLGNNAVNILASALAASLMIRYVGKAGIAYATVVMTILVVIFAEVMPKTYAIRQADRMALVVAPILRPMVSALAPITQCIQLLVLGLLRLFGAGGDSAWTQSAFDEIRGMLDYHVREGSMRKHYRDMLRSVLDLADLEVGEVMVHRRDMVALDIEQPAREIVRQVLESRHTRFPVWRGTPDNVIGTLHAKSLLREVNAYGSELAGLDVLRLTTEPWFVPETTSLADQLSSFRKQRSHFALVVDEYGDLKGLVTLDDILEEIVGDIVDEDHADSDESDQFVTQLSPEPDGSYILDGGVTVRALNRALEWKLPDEDASTIAGLVIHEAKRIPYEGQVFLFYEFQFEIMGRDGNRITKIRIARRPT